MGNTEAVSIPLLLCQTAVSRRRESLFPPRILRMTIPIHFECELESAGSEAAQHHRR